ncbi:MAG: helix-turn-helix domain-containing protein [Anaerolineaceae bacterium]|nr:helix-turn-helix domain-containing protein [Anaerolineaceae bacterium]
MHVAGFRFDIQRLAQLVREKRGMRTLRDIGQELQLSISTLSRIEREHFPPDWHTLFILSKWLDIHPGEFLVSDEDSDQNDLSIQLRAARNMSSESALALMEAVKAMYETMNASRAKENG